jgi:hypothetical protein
MLELAAALVPDVKFVNAGSSRDISKIGHGMAEAVSYVRIGRTEVLPLCNRRTSAALLTPWV